MLTTNLNMITFTPETKNPVRDLEKALLRLEIVREVLKEETMLNQLSEVEAAIRETLEYLED